MMMVKMRTGLHMYNELLGLELGLRMTHLGTRSIMHNIVIYKPIAKVQGVKADQNGTKLP